MTELKSNSPQKTDEDGFLIAYARLDTSPKDVNLWIVDVCPRCGGKHTHGAGGKDVDPNRLLGHRSQHCGDNDNGYKRSGYILTKFEE